MNVIAPPASENILRPPMLLSVEVEEDESVEWIWTFATDGTRFVSGYKVLPQLADLSRGANP